MFYSIIALVTERGAWIDIGSDVESSRPLSPRRGQDASNTFKTIVQSSSVMAVSMADRP